MQEKVLVLHVKKGYEERARHIEQMLHEKGIEFEYVTDGDKPDITADILDHYFADQMHQVTAATSCALKHLYAYERILQNNWNGALILEDDMIFYKHFIPIFNKCMQECKERELPNIFLSKIAAYTLYPKANARKASFFIRPNVTALPDATTSAENVPN